MQTDYYYNATPGSAQRDIKAALRVRRAVDDLADAHGRLSADEFAAAYREALVSIQNSLGSPGPAPVASTATRDAAANRRAFYRTHSAERGRAESPRDRGEEAVCPASTAATTS